MRRNVLGSSTKRLVLLRRDERTRDRELVAPAVTSTGHGEDLFVVPPRDVARPRALGGPRRAVVAIESLGKGLERLLVGLQSIGGTIEEREEIAQLLLRRQ